MSRIGKKPVPVGAAKVTVQDRLVRAEGPKGKLELRVHPDIKVALDADKKNLVVTRPNDEKQSKALHGLTRSLLANLVEGVTAGYRKALEIQGVGYRAALRGTDLELNVGFSHSVVLKAPAGITFEVPTPTEVIVKGIDKQQVGQTAAEVRKVRPPEPYKGKGIRYEGEVVKIKPGKAFAGAGAK